MSKYLLKGIITIIVMVMLFSCENSITEVQEITQQDSLPTVTAYNITYERTDSGYLQMILKSPVMHRYEGDNAYAVFPEGFEVTFYNVSQTPVSFIRANYGISFEKKKVMRARNDVVVINYEDQQQLNTENLIWNQKREEIIANTFVKITTPDRIIFGDSLRAHETFKNREIFNVRAEIEIEEEADSLSY